MSIKGIYQGKSLYINNPLLDENTGKYCVGEILINKNKYETVTNTSAISIDFEKLGLKIGEEYEIILKHGNDCKPEVINPEVLKELCIFEVASFDIDPNGNLVFITKNETYASTFYIEEFRWGYWELIGTLEGKGGPDDRNYSFAINPPSGEVKYRVYKKNYYDKNIYSDEAVFNISKEPVAITSKYKKVKNEITFSDSTRYSVINDRGAEVLKGIGSVVNVSSLAKGKYFLKFEKEFVKFKKK
jgi:hypothetical protein